MEKENKKYLYISVEENLTREIGLEIGVDITQERADELLAMAEEDEEFEFGTNEYDDLDAYVGREVTSTDGFTRVQVYTSNK